MVYISQEIIGSILLVTLSKQRLKFPESKQ